MAAIDQLKCKGGRVKGRKKDGGIINVTSKKRKKKKYEDGGIKKTPFDYGGTADLITDTGATIFDEQKARLQSGYDERESPADIMKKSANFDTGKALLKGAGTGAAIGTAILPGLGTAVGAGAGVLVSGIGRSLGKKGRDEEIAEATKQWSAGWTNKAASYARRSEYKSGGKIKGKGGSKSDQISMTAEDGSFIVPAENAKTGMDIGRTYLGWNDKTTADRKNSGTGIKVSDGELFYTPEEVGVLKYHGIDLDELAPNANSEHKMKKGGFPPNEPNIPINDNWLTVNNFKPITSKTARLEFKNRGISFAGENFDEELKGFYPDQPFMPYKVENGKYYKNFPRSFQIGEGGEKTGTWRPYLDTQTGKSIDYDKEKKFSNGGKLDGKSRKQKRIDTHTKMARNSAYEHYLNPNTGPSYVKNLRKSEGLPDNLTKDEFYDYLDYSREYVPGTRSYGLKGAGLRKVSWDNYMEHKNTPSDMREIANLKRNYGKAPWLDEIVNARVGKLNLNRAAVKQEQERFDKSQGASKEEFSNGGEKGKEIPQSELMMKLFGDGDEEKKEEIKEKKEKERGFLDYIPEIAGTLQALGGAYGLMEAGKKPDLQVSHTLKKLSAETRRLANFGYEPAVLNALNTQIEKTRRDISKQVGDFGGSAMEKMGKLQKLLSTTIDKKAGVVMSDAQEKARKWADVLKIDALKAGQEFDIDKINIADWYKMQDINAGLLSAGISNIVGARQLKAAQDTIRDVGSTSPSFTLKT